jgi:hypothetical protein
MQRRRPRFRTAAYLAGATLAFGSLSAWVVADAQARPTAPGTTDGIASVVPYLVAFPLAFLSVLSLAAAIFVATAPRHRIPASVHRTLGAGFATLLATTLLALVHTAAHELPQVATHTAWLAVADHIGAILVAGVGLGSGLIVLGIVTATTALAPRRTPRPQPARYAKSPYGRLPDDTHDWPPAPPE